MSPTPDQHVIDALVARIDGPSKEKTETNGHGGGAVEDASVLTDQALLEILFGEREKGRQWKDTYSGNYSPYYPSPSEAVAGLLLKAAYYSRRDPAQMDRFIRGSALTSPKFDERRGGTTWIGQEIEKAISKTAEVYQPRDKSKLRVEVHSRSHSLGREGMRNDPEQSIRAISFSGREKPGPREWLVERAICEGHAASWYGESGIAKSLLAAHLGLSIAAPSVDRWAGLRIRTAPVVYGDCELDEVEYLRRCQELAAGMNLADVPDDFHYLALAGLPAEEAFGIAAEECRRLGAGLFIVDSVGFALDGDGELSKDVLRFHKECIGPVKAAGTTPLLIDHQAKVIKGEKYSDKQEFGSVYKTNAVRSSFQIRGAWDGSELTTTFTHKKTNFGPKVADFSLKLLFGNGRVKVERLSEAVPNPDREPTVRERVVDAVKQLGRGTAETIAAQTGMEKKSVQNAISDLINEGLLVDTGEKQGRSRIVIPHSQSTKGTGTGTNLNQESKPGKDDTCPHGTSKAYPCDDCDIDARFGEAF